MGGVVCVGVVFLLQVRKKNSRLGRSVGSFEKRKRRSCRESNPDLGIQSPQ